MKNNRNNLTCLFLMATTISSVSFANIITLFSHGVADKWKQVRQYVKSYKDGDKVYYNENKADSR